MPGILRDPLRTLGPESKHGDVGCGAGENAVAGLELAVEIFIGHVARGLVHELGLAHLIERERAKRISMVAPRIEVPVVAVVDEPLRRYEPLLFRLARAA